MSDFFAEELTRVELAEYVGDFYQIAGAREFTFRNGRADGVKAVTVKTGTGFECTVLPDRGMDIAGAFFRGKPVGWLSKNSIAAPYYFENGGLGFLRTFPGGLLTTCGLTQVGDPGVDGDEVLGIHGRVSHLPAERSHIEESWEGDELVIRVKGSVRESCLYAENLVLKREIVCRMGESKLTVRDEVENQGYNSTPFMLMYHINLGFPVVSPSSRLYTTAESVERWNEAAKCGDGRYMLFERPTDNYEWQAFLHHMPQGAKQPAVVAVVNHDLQFGAYVSYDSCEMPSFNEWKMMGKQDYVVGLEPGINIPEGRLAAKEQNRLRFLEAGESYTNHFEIGVVNGSNDIDRLLSSIRSLLTEK